MASESFAELMKMLDRIEKLLHSNRERTYSKQNVEDMKSLIYSARAFAEEIGEELKRGSSSGIE